MSHVRAKRRQGKLKPDSIARLDEAGFPWNRAPLLDGLKPAASRNDRWDAHYEQLVAFKAKHGHAHPVASNCPDSRLLGWVAYQRVRHRTGKLPPQRVALLDQLGFFRNR